MIYSPSSTFVIAVKKEPSCTISDGMTTCCWNVECEGGGNEEHCMNCKQKSNGQWECGNVFTPGLVGTPMCPVKTDSGLTVRPSDDGDIPPNIKELLGSSLSDNPTIRPGDDNGIPPLKGKGLLGLLDENIPTIQQPSPETTTPPKDKTINLLSNFDDSIMTHVPKGDSGFPNLLKEESENILNDEDNKEKEPKQGEEQEQLTASQEDELQSEESDEEQEHEEQPPLTETFNSNTELVE